MPTLYHLRDGRTFIYGGADSLEARRQADRAARIAGGVDEALASGRDKALALLTDQADAAIARARTWADGEETPDPTDPASRSARLWARQARVDGEEQAAIARACVEQAAHQASRAEAGAAIALANGETQTALSSAAAEYSNQQALRSELAATQAILAQPLHETVAAGLAATAPGGVFRVRGSGSTYAIDYRNEAGAAVQLGAFPSKAYMDGIAPAVNGKVIALSRAANVDVANPVLDNGTAIRAALSEAMASGKTVDLGTDVFRMGTQWGGALAVTQTLKVRGDGGKFVATNGIGAKNFLALRAPISIEGVSFDNFAALITCDTNGIDLSDHDLVLRYINHLNCGQGLVLNTLESSRIRDLIIEGVTLEGLLNANGTGRGQGIRYQANGFRRAYLRNIFVRNCSYQGVRVGGYPHDLVLNRHIHMEAVHVDGVVSNGQSNGVQAFGSDVYMDDIFVRRVDCVDGASSNVEPVYTVGDRVSLGNIHVESAGNAQGGIAIKSSKTVQHGPIRYRTHLHPRMSAAIRIDGSDADLTKGITIEWIYEPLVASTPDGGTVDAYAVNYMRLDTMLTDTVEHYFVPHAVNTTSAPTLKIGPFGAKVMMQSTGGPVYPGQLRTDVVYKAVYQPATDRILIRAAIWTANVPIVDGNNNNIALPDAPVDGKAYWAIPMRTMLAGATLTLGGQTFPIMVRGEAGLTPLTSNGLVSNGFIKGFYYSAADAAVVVIAPGGQPYPGVGRFVSELAGSGDAFTFRHPYPNEYADALFVMSPRDNAGPATLNGEPLLTSSGAEMAAGYLRAFFIYQLTREGSTWRATRIGGSFNGIDTATGAGGRQIIKDVTFINAQYAAGIASYSDGFAEVSNIKTFGRSRLGRVAAFSTTSEAPIQARAYASDFKITHFGIDPPSTSLIGVSQRFASLEVDNIPPPVIRGTVAQSSAVVAGVTTAGAIGLLRMRGVRKGASGYNPVTQAQGFAAIDSDHVTETASIDPPAIGAGGYSEFAVNFTHVGAEPGDAVTVTHEQNNTRLQFGGYCTARDTVKAFVRDPNPAGGAVDLPPGRLFISSRRLRP